AERLFGNLPFAVLYFLAGLAGSLASVWSHDAVGVGASGAIFGVLGGILGYVVRQRRTIPGAFAKGLTRNVLVVIAINVAIGLSIPQVDNSAHLGGLATGVLVGAALALPLSPEGVRRRLPRAGVVLLLGLAAVAGAILLLSR